MLLSTHTIKETLSMARASKPPGLVGTSPNAVQAALNAMEYDPIAHLIRMATDPAIDPKDQIGIAKELLQYTAPKLKSIEVRGNVGFDGRVQIVKYGDEDPDSMDQIPEA
jgi:hypothetical protein